MRGKKRFSQRSTVQVRINVSKAQYEGRLKKWGFRKNKTKEDWKTIRREIEKRNRQRKASDVYFCGKLISAKKVRKETSRYGPMSTVEMYTQGNRLPPLQAFPPLIVR